MKLQRPVVFTLALPVIAATLLSLSLAAAAEPGSTSRSEAITMNAGETQVIENLSPSATPAIKVVENPHALVVNSEAPGKLVLVGAEEGKWDISVNRADGGEVTYHVTVHAIRDWNNLLKPDKAPNGDLAAAPAPAAAGSGTKTASAAASETKSVGFSSADGGHAAPQPATAAPASAGSVASQSANPQPPGDFRSDPSVVSSGEGYSTEGVAASGGAHYLPADGISMMAGMSQIFDFAQKMRRVSIADTEVADVQVVSPYQLNLIGHKPGFTTLAVWTGQGHYEERQVRVDPGGKQQIMLNCVVAELNRQTLENQGINLSMALSNYGVSLVGLPGAVATPYSQNTSGSSGSSSTLPPGGQIIPLLLSQNLTYGLSAQNSNILTQGFFQFLEQHNAAKILAQPHLLANSGEKAKFLSGGEIPIVIAQALNTSIVFKEFGTKVMFLPTVVGVNEIEMLVQPEESEPDYAHGVQLFGFQVPAFVTRRAETLVRLKDSQTLIIAGLILHQKREVIDKVPYLGDIPYAGGLFRNTSWQDMETDLVMSVTPQIVRPLPTGGQVSMPTNVPPLTSEEIRTQRLSTPDAARPRF